MLHWAWKPIRQPARSPPDTVVTIAIAGSTEAIRSSKASLTAWRCCHVSRVVAAGGSGHPSGLVGPDGELDPVPGAELGHEPGQVELDGARADVELLRDLRVRPASGDGEEHRLLSLGEGLERLGRR